VLHSATSKAMLLHQQQHAARGSAAGCRAQRASAAPRTAARAARASPPRMRPVCRAAGDKQQQVDKERRQLSFLARVGAVAAASVLLVGAGGFDPKAVSYSASAAGASGDDYELPFAKPVVTTESTPRARQLATRLKKSGAKLLTAFWCSHW
jgi:hypothetical protein